MRGSIGRKKIKNVTHYYVVYDLPRLKGEKRRQKWVPVGTSYREAEKKLPDIMMQAKKQLHPDSETVCFEEVASDYLFHNRSRLASSTYQRYEGIVKKLSDYFQGERLGHIEPYHVEQLTKKLIQNGLQPHTIMKYQNVLKQVFEYAKELGMIESVPIAKRHRASRVSTYDFQVWSSHEANAFLLCIQDTPLYMPVCIAVHTGMRLGEVLALKWSEIDFEHKQLTVRYSVDLKGQLKTTKTKQSRRIIKLTDSMIQTLKAYQHGQKVQALRLGKDYYKSDFVCTFPDGKPLSRNYVSVTFRRKVKQHHFPVIRFHDLRHSFATIALSHNVHTKVVQEILGHASSRTTLDVYSHVIPTMQAQSVELLEKAFQS